MTQANNRANPLLLAFATLLLAAALVLGWLMLNERGDYTFTMDLDDIPVDQPIYRAWHGQWLLLIRPSPALLADQRDQPRPKARQLVDPPEKTPRDQYPVKVFLFDRNQGYLMFGYQKWYNTVIPCASFHYINRAFVHEDEVIQGGFICSLSLDDFWQDKLVFDLFGRAHSKQVPDLYSPWYRVQDNRLIVGQR